MVGVRIFDEKGVKILKLGNVRSVLNEPATEKVFLNENERIVGIYYKKATYKWWLQMQSDFAFIVQSR